MLFWLLWFGLAFRVLAHPFPVYLKYVMLLACSGFPILIAAIVTA